MRSSAIRGNNVGVAGHWGIFAALIGFGGGSRGQAGVGGVGVMPAELMSAYALSDDGTPFATYADGQSWRVRTERQATAAGRFTGTG